MNHKNRFYRNREHRDRWQSFTVKEDTTDLFILSSHECSLTAKETIHKLRNDLKQHIEHQPEFLTSLMPIKECEEVTSIIQDMYRGSKQAGVGPMASVAGAIAEHTGKKILEQSEEVIVENGGDLWLDVKESVVISIYAGDSPFSGKVGIQINPELSPCAVCTSSGKLGHSLSLGRANSATVIAENGALADALATEVGNRVKEQGDVEKALRFVDSQPGVHGVLIIYRDTMAAQGNITLINPQEEQNYEGV